MTFAVYEKYIQNLDDVFEDDADPIFFNPELAYTCECTDEAEVIAFNRFLYGNYCDPSFVIEVVKVSSQAQKHFCRAEVKSQLMKTFAILADIMGVERARNYGSTDLVAASLAEG